MDLPYLPDGPLWKVSVCGWCFVTNIPQDSVSQPFFLLLATIFKVYSHVRAALCKLRVVFFLVCRTQSVVTKIAVCKYGAQRTLRLRKCMLRIWLKRPPKAVIVLG